MQRLVISFLRDRDRVREQVGVVPLGTTVWFRRSVPPNEVVTFQLSRRNWGQIDPENHRNRHLTEIVASGSIAPPLP
jgi:hypothetical protein